MRVFHWFALALVVAPSAAAQSPSRLALADVVAEAVKTHPEIAAAQHRHDAARLRPSQERSLPDPMFSAGYSSIGNPLPGAGLGTEPLANMAVMVSQEIPYPGKRDLRAAIATREAEAEGQQVEAARLSVVARVKKAYYRLAYAVAVGDVLARNQRLLETLLKVSEGRYAVGHAAQQDVIKAQAQVSLLDVQRRRIERERAARIGELNALLNRRPTSPLGRPDDLVPMPFDVSIEHLISLADEHAPMLRRDRILIDRSQAAIDSARTEFQPDFVVSGGYAYMGSMPPMYQVRVDVKLPLRRERRQAAVAEQLTALDAARSSYDSSRLALRASLQDDYEMAATSARLATLYRDTVLPQARLALESSMASYQTGAVEFLSVLSSFGSVLEYEMAYVEELTAFHVAVSQIEEMTGTALVH